MEMWFKRSILVLLTGLVVSGQASVILDDQQRRVVVSLGSSVTFHCLLKTPPYCRLRVSWYLNPSSFNDSNKLYNQMVYNKTCSAVSNKTKQNSSHGEPNTNGNWRTYTFTNVTEKNSGRYFCKVTVEIPFFIGINSSGTEVVITNSKEHTTYPSLPIVTATMSDNFSVIDWWMWIMLGVSSLILIVMLVICVLLRRRRHRSEGEDPIYANTRRVANKQPSPRPGADHLKPDSSSHNLRCQSPGGKYGEGKRRYK